MKKRIIAFASALALSLTTFASLSISASAVTEPTIKAEILDSEGNVITDASKLNVGDTFNVQYSYEGFNNLTEYVGGRTKTGTIITSIQFLANIPCDDTNLYWESWTSSNLTKKGAAQINEDYDNSRLVYAVSYSDPTSALSTPSGILGNIEVTVKQPITSDWVFDYDLTYDTKVYVNTIVKGVDNLQQYIPGAESFALNMVPATLSAGSKDVPATAIKLDKTELDLDLNGKKTGKITAIVEPTDTTDKVAWDSKDKTIATVDENGNVTAVAEGKTTITATIGALDPVACTVTVKDTTPPEQPIVDVTPSKITGDYGTKTLKYIAKIVKNADATAFIKVTKTLNGKTESKETTQTIAELLGGVATEGTLVSADVAIGVLTADTDAVFSFGLVK